MPQPPGLLQKFWNLLEDTERWIKSGRPVVSEEVRAARRAKCDPCPDRDKEKDSCNWCGCPLHPTPLGDKLERATSFCPKLKDGKPAPEWEATFIPSEELLLSVQPKPEEMRIVVGIGPDLKAAHKEPRDLQPADAVVLGVAVLNGKLVPEAKTLKELLGGARTGVYRVMRDFALLPGLAIADVKFGLMHIRDGRPTHLTPEG
jgi:hypothetical protein